MAISPPEAREREITKTGLERLIERLKDFLHDFKRERIGIVGIFVLLIIVAWGVSGIFFGDPDDTLYSGDSPPAAAPIWAATFEDKGPIRDQTIIDQNFKGIPRTSDLNSHGVKFETMELTVSNKSFLDANVLIEDGALKLSFRDTGMPYTKKKPPSSYPSARIVVSRPIQWKKAKAPNNYIFNFKYKYSFPGLNTSQLFGNDPVYKFQFTSYIKTQGMSLANMLNILERNGTGISESQIRRPYGIKWSAKTPNLPITSWEEKKSTINLGDALTIFRLFDDLEVNFVAEIELEKIPALDRGRGDFTIHIGQVTFIGRGYYAGLAGTTAYGGDLFTLIAKGMKNDIVLGLTSTSVLLFLGIVFGLVSGYFGGAIDEAIMRLSDFLMVLPTLPLMIVLAYVFQASGISRTWGIVMSISFVQWAGLARFIRSQVLSERERPYIEAARASGAPHRRIMFGHIFPNIIGIVIYQIVLSLQSVILTTAALNFLGLGPEFVSFGRLLQQLTQVSLGQQSAPSPVVQRGGLLAVWWFTIFPGLLLFLFGTSLIFIGMAFQRIIGGRGRIQEG